MRALESIRGVLPLTSFAAPFDVTTPPVDVDHIVREHAANHLPIDQEAIMSKQSIKEGSDKSGTAFSPWPFFGANRALDYWVDAWQPSILLLDVLRQRGNNCIEHNARKAPHVLSFEAELVLDGRSLPRPVNYALVRIVAPKGIATDQRKRPFIVFDPRAGHGPGIGGMKHDSEIGVALAAGHPCYFVGFLPDPVPGQTIEDVCETEARFVEEVVALHPNAEGKPCLIGNCQAGWQIIMMSATHPRHVCSWRAPTPAP
jgi:hypothetical protein